MTIDELDAIVVEAIVFKDINKPIGDTYCEFYRSKGLTVDSLGECYLYYKIKHINYNEYSVNMFSKEKYSQIISQLGGFIKQGYSIFKECPRYD